MKKILLVLTLFVTACSGIDLERSMLATPPSDTQYPVETPMPAATSTEMGTPTPDAAATVQVANTQLAIAQATADEARRVNVMVTSEYQQMMQEQLFITADAEQREFIRQGWTATAALTSIPLTSTAQVDNNTAIASYSTLSAGWMTATIQAPTQVVAMARAESEKEFMYWENLARVFLLFAMGVFLILIGAFAARYVPDPKKPAVSIPVEPEPQIIHPIDLNRETVLNVRESYGNGFDKTERMVVPCSEDQLTELAEKILAGERSMAINDWERRKGAGLYGAAFARVRSWAQLNRFVVSTRGGELAITETFKNFLTEWLNKRALPTQYQFGGQAQ